MRASAKRRSTGSLTLHIATTNEPIQKGNVTEQNIGKNRKNNYDTVKNRSAYWKIHSGSVQSKLESEIKSYDVTPFSCNCWHTSATSTSRASEGDWAKLHMPPAGKQPQVFPRIQIGTLRPFIYSLACNRKIGYDIDMRFHYTLIHCYKSQKHYDLPHKAQCLANN